MRTKINFKHICYFIGIGSYFLAFLGTLIFPALTYLTYQRIARRGFLISLIVASIANLFLLIGKKYLSKNIIQQMLTIYCILSAIFLPMFVRTLLDTEHVIYSIFNWLELAFVIFGLFFWGIQSIKVKVFKCLKRNLFFLLPIMTIVVLLAFTQLNTVIKGDSVEYYSKIIRICHNFSFSPNDISLLKSSGHCCYAYSLFSTIGENIIPYFGLGVRIENIIIWLICILYTWKILKKMMPNISNVVSFGTTACFAFTPLILGNIQEIGIELYVIFFFILFFYSCISQKHILEMFFAICFVFTKEPNIVILAGFYLGLFINQIVIVYKTKQVSKIFDRDFILSSLSCYIAAIIFCIYFAIDTQWGKNASFDYGNMIRGNTFGINEVYIISKLKQMFILNFAWLPTAALVISILICIYKRESLIKKNKYTLSLVLTYICFLGVQLFYITYTLPRYIYLQYLYLAFVLAFIFNTCITNSKFVKFFLAGNICILLFQNFYNFDPISYFLFDTMNTGKRHMIFDNPCYIGLNGEFITYKDEEISYIQPYGMTNKQFSYFDKMLEMALDEINYTETDLIILPMLSQTYPDNFYWGNCLSTYYFDTHRRQFVQIINDLVPVPENIDKIYVQQITPIYKLNKFNSHENVFYYDFIFSTYESGQFDSYSNVYYFDFSFSDTTDKFVHENFRTDKLLEIEYNGWDMTIYTMGEKL